MGSIPVRYLTLSRPAQEYVRTRSLAEQLVRRALERQGYIVSRGALLDCLFEHTFFDETDAAQSVRLLLQRTHGTARLIRMAKYCARHHGTPDFLAVHAARGPVGVECKLGHESVKEHQLLTMERLMAWGIPCEVWRVMPRTNAVREKQIDLDTFARTHNLRDATRTTARERRVTVYGKRKQ